MKTLVDVARHPRHEASDSVGTFLRFADRLVQPNLGIAAIGEVLLVHHSAVVLVYVASKKHPLGERNVRRAQPIKGVDVAAYL